MGFLIFFIIIFIFTNVMFLILRSSNNLGAKFLVGFLITLMLVLVTDSSYYSLTPFIKILVFSFCYCIFVGLHFFIYKYLNYTKYTEYLLVSIFLNILTTILISLFLGAVFNIF